jgi:aldose 1-epimerase
MNDPVARPQFDPTVTRREFSRLPGGEPVDAFVLRNARGIELEAIGYGCVVTRLIAPDRFGRTDDIVLGYRTLEEYLADRSFFGAVVGRFANRLAHGRFTLDGRPIQLALNNHPAGQSCHLHGGVVGFHRHLWSGQAVTKPGAAGVAFRRRSPDGEEGYPGNLDVCVTYWLNNDNEWRVEYEAATDRPTPVNLTQHSSFNLAGEGADILGHELQIHASRFTPVTPGLIPTGEWRPVKDTPFDFSRPRRIGDGIAAPDEQLGHGKGYDHNWVLDHAPGALAPAAMLREPVSGRVLEVFTTEPGLQVYTGNFLDGSTRGKSGRPHAFRTGVCLETQHFPDSPNQPGFPDTILRPPRHYRSTTVYRIGLT